MLLQAFLVGSFCLSPAFLGGLVTSTQRLSDCDSHTCKHHNGRVCSTSSEDGYRTLKCSMTHIYEGSDTLIEPDKESGECDCAALSDESHSCTTDGETLSAPKLKRDWDIGCDSSNKNCYYTDDSDSDQPVSPQLVEGVWNLSCDELGMNCVFTDGLGTPTRCNPLQKQDIERFDGANWTHLATCKDSGCRDIAGRASCESGRIVVNPRDETLTRRQLDPIFGPIDSRCEPINNTWIQVFDSRNWISAYRCRDEGLCINFEGSGACQMDKNVVETPIFISWPFPRFSERSDPPPPDFHSLYTRCRPLGEGAFTIIERQNPNGTMVLHYTCPVEGSCIDLEGIGACYLGFGHYDVPAANDTTNLTKPLKPSRMILRTRCNPKNSTEVQRWHTDKWALDGLCHPPYECVDFRGNATFAICTLPELVSKSVYMPWPLPKSANRILTGRNTRSTYKENKLSIWDDTDRVHKYTCEEPSHCGPNENWPHNGGCHCPWPEQIYLNQRQETENDSASDDNNPGVHERKEQGSAFPLDYGIMNSRRTSGHARRSSGDATGLAEDHLHMVKQDTERGLEQCNRVERSDERCKPGGSETVQKCMGSKHGGYYWRDRRQCSQRGRWCLEKGVSGYRHARCSKYHVARRAEDTHNDAFGEESCTQGQQACTFSFRTGEQTILLCELVDSGGLEWVKWKTCAPGQHCADSGDKAICV